jgi:hypothetical protein
MKNRTMKLMLSRETLRHLEESRTTGPDASCVQSCYLVSCGGDCGISTGVKQLTQGD